MDQIAVHMVQFISITAAAMALTGWLAPNKKWRDSPSPTRWRRRILFMVYFVLLSGIGMFANLFTFPEEIDTYWEKAAFFVIMAVVSLGTSALVVEGTKKLGIIAKIKSLFK